MSARTGDRLGRVDQVLIDFGSRQIAGFRLRRGGPLDRRWRVAAIEDVSTIDDEAVAVPDEVALREDTRDDGHVALRPYRMAVKDEQGRTLGQLIDALISRSAGRIAALLVQPTRDDSGAFPLPRWVPIRHLRAGEADAVVLSDEGAAMLLHQPTRETP